MTGNSYQTSTPVMFEHYDTEFRVDFCQLWKMVCYLLKSDFHTQFSS